MKRDSFPARFKILLVVTQEELVETFTHKFAESDCIRCFHNSLFIRPRFPKPILANYYKYNELAGYQGFLFNEDPWFRSLQLGKNVAES